MPRPRIHADHAAKMVAYRERLKERIAPASGLVVVPTRYGQMIVPANDRFIGRSLIKYGEYSEAEVERFRQVLKPGDYVVEVGANIGALTIPLAHIVGERGHVVAFEPHPDIYKLLGANTELAGASNITLYRRALSDHHANGAISTAGDNCGAGALHECEDGETTVIKLDGLYGYHRLDFLKIDVEGHEERVLRGAEKAIRKHRPILYVEDDREDNSAPLRRYIDSLGYNIYPDFPPLFNPNNFNGDPEDVMRAPNGAPLASFMLLCAPKEMPQTVNVPPIEVT